jgi:hypothetical protein
MNKDTEYHDRFHPTNLKDRIEKCLENQNEQPSKELGESLLLLGRGSGNIDNGIHVR